MKTAVFFIIIIYKNLPSDVFVIFNKIISNYINFIKKAITNLLTEVSFGYIINLFNYLYKGGFSMKVKKLSKVLAMLLAVVMIFTTLPLMAFAEEPKTFNVTLGMRSILKCPTLTPLTLITRVHLL